MSEVELLSPVGEWDALVSAVQNGADAVYFGADEFNARMNSKNFNKEELTKAIEYAKIHNVKTNLTLNILIKDSEFKAAMELVEFAYKAGIDAVIVQDLGLANRIIKKFPDLDVHASTQMTIHSVEGVKEIERLGFKRCVLARELNIEEIKKICKNTNIEIEVFIHGALCICYSGQCLMSSIIGGRSGNRGKCAGTCRLPYELLKDNKSIDKGYLLSSKDVCTLDILPELIKAGIKSFKIEGRMKSPIYVGIVSSIYRKYIDLANSGKPYKVDKDDKEKLMQIFNRGGFSTGYLKGKLGKDMMYKYKPNHIGIYVGTVINYNSNKGYAKIKCDKDISLGDSIAIQDASCKISELMIRNTNIKTVKNGEIATIGRINGKIKSGDKVYRTVQISLNKEIEQSILKENRKRDIEYKIILKENEPIYIKITDKLSGINVESIGDKVQKAENNGISRDRIEEQLCKLGNTVFNASKIEIDMPEKIFISISSLNEIRRNSIYELENKIKQSFKRKFDKVEIKNVEKQYNENNNIKVSLCLNKIDKNLNYLELKNVDRVYIPLRFFTNSEFNNKIKEITKHFNTYLLMPTIYKENYENIDLSKILNDNIKGVVISNLAQINMFKGYNIVANYTFNIWNNYTVEDLNKMGITEYIVSPEVDKNTIINLDNNISKEIIVYGRTLLMTSEYCTIGTFKNCPNMCSQGCYKLKDRLGFEFPILTDRINCNNLIYNSKITSIKWKGLNPDSIRIDIIDENIEEINKIIEVHRSGERLEGQDYTNGNLNNEFI